MAVGESCIWRCDSRKRPIAWSMRVVTSSIFQTVGIPFPADRAEPPAVDTLESNGYEVPNTRVEVILNGHDHLYERFARQTSDGRADPVGGIRQFIVGTGGAEIYRFVRAAPNSEERIAKFGVIRLTLRPAQVDWEFLGIDGTIGDRGLDTCR